MPYRLNVFVCILLAFRSTTDLCQGNNQAVRNCPDPASWNAGCTSGEDRRCNGSAGSEGTEMPGGLSRWLSGLDKVPRAEELTKIYRSDTKRPHCCKCVVVCSGVYTNAESLEG